MATQRNSSLLLMPPLGLVMLIGLKLGGILKASVHTCLSEQVMWPFPRRRPRLFHSSPCIDSSKGINTQHGFASVNRSCGHSQECYLTTAVYVLWSMAQMKKMSDCCKLAQCRAFLVTCCKSRCEDCFCDPRLWFLLPSLPFRL